MRNPEQRALLRQNPGLTRNAIEELLRYEAPAQWVGRVAHEPLEIHGQRIEPDDLVWILIGSASRDPEVFDQPDKLDLAREGIRPIAFGRGPHMCLGQPLARLEAQIALPAILDALADFDLAPQDIRYKPTSTLRCPSALLLTC
jgi:cytochrome P450